MFAEFTLVSFSLDFNRASRIPISDVEQRTVSESDSSVRKPRKSLNTTKFLNNFFEKSYN